MEKDMAETIQQQTTGSEITDAQKKLEQALDQANEKQTWGTLSVLNSMGLYHRSLQPEKEN